MPDPLPELPPDLPPDLADLDPDEVLAFLRTASESAIRDRVHDLGTARVLPLLFQAWADRVPAAPRPAGVLLFVLDDDAPSGRVQRRHALDLSPAGARHLPDPPRSRASVTTSVVRFLRIAAGAQDPARLVVTGRLRMGGDVVWAVRVLSGLKPA